MTWHRNPLNEDQLESARRQFAAGEPMSHIARALGVRPDWLKCLLDPKHHEKRRASRRETAARRRMAEGKRILPPIIHPDVHDRVVVPQDVLFEREARRCAPLSLSALFFGDPPRGFSALEGKGR